MVKYFCDICGKECPPSSEDGMYPARAACPSVGDVCPECAKNGRELNVEKLVLEAWRLLQWRKKGIPAAVVPKPAEQDGAANAGTVDIPDEAADPAASQGDADSTPAPAEAATEPETDMASEDAAPVHTEDSGTGASAGKGDPAAQEAKPKKGPGSHWAEKRETLERLQAYRESGLGSTSKVAEAAGISYDAVRAMLSSMPRPIEEWRKVKAALDTLEKEPAS